MGINFDEKNRIFYLHAKDTSYILQILSSGYLAHLYWGKRIKSIHPEEMIRLVDRPFEPNPDPRDRGFSLDTIPLEYPSYGHTDFRNPAYQIQLENGTTITDLRYKNYKVYNGKPGLKPLPATYVENVNEASTLEIELFDEVAGLRAVLSYTIFEELDVIARSVRFENTGSKKLKILRALSMSVDFPRADFEMLHLSGAWARERHMERRVLKPGMQGIESRRGASSHQHNPFLALIDKGADENHGEIFAVNLVYSGNFSAQAEVDSYSTTRLSIGINPFDFSWLLEPGESFQTPEAVMVYSPEGFGRMSRTFHKLYRTRLCRGVYKKKERPVLVNNWEATYFDFNSAKILELGKSASELGIELLVLDDGWFGNRDTDNSSLGDWFVDRNKLPEGLDHLARGLGNLGLKFGLWFEPEMISPNSDLYRAHPDWCLHVPERNRSEGRNQLILDLSRSEVCDAVTKMIKDILSSAPIAYVKWDMNRHMTEIGSAALPAERQKETAHRYMLNLYKMLEDMTSSFPEVLFESCSGGGGRFDPGMLYFMPQVWTSDNTDAVERLKIQYGTSLIYPLSAMGSHVSAVPNHQVFRSTPLETRGMVAMSGTFGYELDLTKMSDEEKRIVKKQIEMYKEIRHLIQFGDFYRLLNPFESNEAAWIFVSEDKTEAFAAYFSVLAIPNPPLKRLRLDGLDPEKDYRVEGIGKVFGGDELMNSGLAIPELQGDFQGVVWRLRSM
ncbi:MAG: alpha-galactosidase [Clostridia bacterium]|nr:alpha-galactosidase [Clostridia bacterium]